MAKKYDYMKLDTYVEAKNMVIMVYSLLKKFPKEETYALCDQLRRAVISIPSNIAEGSGRRSPKEQIHFIEIAFGSLCEVNCQLDIAHELGYISSTDMETITEQSQKVGALLSGLRNHHIQIDNQ